MSKDFTPREFHLTRRYIQEVDKSQSEPYLGNITYVIHDKDGNAQQLDMYSDRCQSLREMHPNFSSVFFSTDKLMDKIGDNNTLLEVLDALERMSTLIEEYEDSRIKGYPSPDISVLPETFIDWFNGNLDKGFYCSEVNTQLFVDWITNSYKDEILTYKE